MVSHNIQFPFRDDTEKNTLISSTKISKEALSSNLMLLLLTRKGERYYDPNYGTNLLKFLFDPNDSILESEIAEDLRRTVSRYMPNLTIDNLSFNKESDDEHRINVLILFTYNEDGFTEQGQLELTF